MYVNYSENRTVFVSCLRHCEIRSRKSVNKVPLYDRKTMSLAGRFVLQEKYVSSYDRKSREISTQEYCPIGKRQ